MSVEISGGEGGDDFDFDFIANLAAVPASWCGREITIEEMLAFKRRAEERVLQFFASLDPNSPEFDQMAARLTLLGTAPHKRPLAERELSQFLPSKNGRYTQVGFWNHPLKSTQKAWKEHKTEIIIGITVIVVVTTVVAVTLASGGAAGEIAAVAGCAALDRLCNTDGDQDTPKPLPRPTKPKSSILALPPYTNSPRLEEFLSQKELIRPPSKPYFEPSPTPSPLIAESGFKSPPKEIDLDKILDRQSTYPNTSPPRWAYPAPPVDYPPLVQRELPPWQERRPKPKGAGQEPQKTPPPQPRDPFVQPNLISRSFGTLGPRHQSLRIMGINGMATEVEGALSHQTYLKSLVPNQEVGVDWVYNKTHTVVADLLEIAGINYHGVSPITAPLLQEQWQEFHEANRDNPNAKCLQFCHSQGALHTYNALIGAPQEIRDRVIVVAIAPAKVVPDDACYRSFNYASRKDIVHYGELSVASALDTNEFGMSPRLKMTLEDHKELILLEPHPEATGIDHDFQSPTFKEFIARRIEEYLSNKGEYK